VFCFLQKEQQTLNFRVLNMRLALGTQTSYRLICVQRASVVRRRRLIARSSYVPDYSSPDSSKLNDYLSKRSSEPEQDDDAPSKPFW